MTLNVENILKLADYVENARDFHIESVHHCIHGQCRKLFRGEEVTTVLGLDDNNRYENEEYGRLIMPEGWLNDDGLIFTKERAAATLRRLAVDGFPVNWGEPS